VNSTTLEGAQRLSEQEEFNFESKRRTAMSLAESMLAEFEAQAPVTRKFLERLPEDRLTWKPHDRSMSAGQLAYHLASVPG
jgi:hypothetical protein